MLPLMPQLLCALAEKTSRQLIAMDPACLPVLARLQHKQLAVTFRDIKLTLVIGASTDSLLFNQHNERTDCHISADFATLRQLRDASQLTRLIKSDALQIEGDLQVAQQFSHFLQQLNPDWQQTLARYIGDGPAHKISTTLRQLQQALSAKLQQLTQLQVELAQDELLLAPSRVEHEHFSQQLNALEARTELLRRQITKLQE